MSRIALFSGVLALVVLAVPASEARAGSIAINAPTDCQSINDNATLGVNGTCSPNVTVAIQVINKSTSAVIQSGTTISDRFGNYMLDLSPPMGVPSTWPDVDATVSVSDPDDTSASVDITFIVP